MSVNIDTVYQKVLMFANKEQRGYITPQEFNLFANQAQLEIFEQYFYDINFYMLKRDNSSEYSDIIDNLNEKIAFFESMGAIVGGDFSAPNIYRVGTVKTAGGIEVEEVQPNELSYMLSAPLTQPTNSRPVYVRQGATGIKVYPAALATQFHYIKKPTAPNWSYVVVNGKAMYDNSQAKDFELHPSEENELTYKILKYAGVSMKRDDIAQGGQGLEMLQIQQEKQ
tara:strand:+ start:24 stop:698 length:675 start_codon:yes stop_codon:yes gene_type:complete